MEELLEAILGVYAQMQHPEELDVLAQWAEPIAQHVLWDLAGQKVFGRPISNDELMLETALKFTH